jgi:hypothetical protein
MNLVEEFVHPNKTILPSYHFISLSGPRKKMLFFFLLLTRYATSLFIVIMFCQMPLPQPLPQDAPTTSPTALQNDWKIGTTPHCMTALPICGFIISTFAFHQRMEVA